LGFASASPAATFSGRAGAGAGAGLGVWARVVVDEKMLESRRAREAAAGAAMPAWQRRRWGTGFAWRRDCSGFHTIFLYFFVMIFEK
jgi:hypothetical protein